MSLDERDFRAVSDYLAAVETELWRLCELLRRAEAPMPHRRAEYSRDPANDCPTIRPRVKGALSVALSIDRYHAVMKMPNPQGQADPCALLLPELLAVIPKHVSVTLPTQGTAMLRYALGHEGIQCREFSLRQPEHLAPDAIQAMERPGVLVLVFPQTLPDRHGEYGWTAGALRLTCQALVDVARTCCFRMVLQPFIPGVVSLEDTCKDMQAPFILAQKDWGTCLSYLLCKEF